ncbi:hypothetical protein IJ531_03165 [bacterium]|nr:hypothetical protein [bacterium]
MSEKSKITIILPFKNQENIIKQTVEKLVIIVKNLIQEEKLPQYSSILLLDNNSKDNSWYEMGKLVARNPYLVSDKKLMYDTKTSAIIKNNPNCIIVDYKNYIKLEQNLDKSNYSISNNFIKDIFKSSIYLVIDELQ